MDVSRRRFAELTGTAILVGSPVAGQPRTVTAQQVVERIQKNVGVPWRQDSFDTFKAGDPAMPLTGIATTAMATMDVLSRASKERANLVVTLEPTYFGRLDGMAAGAAAGGRGQTGVSPDDPVYIAKKEFIRKNGLVVWRFSDHWRTRKPDPFAIGLAQTLAWSKYQVEGRSLPLRSARCDVGRRWLTTWRSGSRLALASALLAIRKPGSAASTCYPASSTLAATMKSAARVRCVVAGETREWESVEYAQDTVASGQKKGLIMLGRVCRKTLA